MFGQNLITTEVEWSHVPKKDTTSLDCTDQTVIYFSASRSSCVAACFLQPKVIKTFHGNFVRFVFGYTQIYQYIHVLVREEYVLGNGCQDYAKPDPRFDSL